MGSARSQRPGECSKGHSGECPHMIAQGVNAQGVSHTVTWSLCSIRNPESLHPVSRSPRTHCSPSQSSPVSPRPISPREIWTARVQYHTQSCTHTLTLSGCTGDRVLWEAPGNGWQWAGAEACPRGLNYSHTMAGTLTYSAATDTCW